MPHSHTNEKYYGTQDFKAFGSISGTLRVIKVHDDEQYVINPTVGATDMHPSQMEVHEIEIHPNQDELPTLSSFAGIAPEATGEVSGRKYNEFCS